MFLGWYDPSPRRPVAEKVQAVLAAYLRKFGREATRVLAHPDDVALMGERGGEVDAVVAPTPGIPRGAFYAGQADDG